MINYKGNRWYKCDFHLHTPASKCFTNNEVTPEEFITKVKEENLDCIAITDHNNCGWIEEIRRVSKSENIVVFPGVEITCSDSKVHLLVLFDIDCDVREIEYFLRNSEVKTSGEGELYTQKSISDIVEKARISEALVIPAHIDSFSGLSNVDMHIIKDFLELDNIRAVQMVHKELILGLEDGKKSEEDVLDELDKTGCVKYEDAKKYLACAKVVKEKELGILTFSDNPNSEGDSKHGLWGIGKEYSWIKMSESPNLESLRQALLFPNSRIKNCFNKNNGRYKMPDLWIKKVKISNIELLDEDSLEIDFNPQLNTLIGGRGSGKSTVVRFLTGVFFDDNMKQLEDIFCEFKSFFQIKNKGRGVLKKETEVQVELVKNNNLYRVTKKNIKDIESDSNIIMEKINSNGDIENIEDISIQDFFKIDIYNQKQIYELAKKTNVLRDKIDSLCEFVEDKKKEADNYLNEYRKEFMEIKLFEKEISSKKKILTDIRDLNEKIETYNESGINKIIEEYKNYNNQLEVSRKYVKYIERKIEILESDKADLLIKFSSEADFILETEIESLINESEKSLESTINEINKIIRKLKQIREDYIEKFKISKFYENYKITDCKYKESISKLKEKGIDISKVDKLIKLQQEKKNELSEILKKENSLEERYSKLEKLRIEYIKKRKELTKERNSLSSKLLNETIKIKVNSFRDKDDFRIRIRKIIDKQTGFEADIEKIVEFCFNGGEISARIGKLYDEVYNLKYNNIKMEGYNGRFINILKELNDASMAELGILLPEDEIKIQYKTKESNEYKPILNASAGQRTSAILTFILSDGINPLILDQPEDDLDNHLIYSLIVEGLKTCKENRQVIIVTHNANIPVNGDSELIISMNSSSKSVGVLEAGTLENDIIKNEICSVMEGGEEAFRMRASRYGIMKI